MHHEGNLPSQLSVRPSLFARVLHAKSAGMQGGNLASCAPHQTTQSTQLAIWFVHASKLLEMAVLFNTKWVRSVRSYHGDPPV